ncbi:MAG: hypothetical protein MI724_06230 [Spirochaetales bacterium]|nr:hypothetical protein [Spirochaetales bacterium]
MSSIPVEATLAIDYGRRQAGLATVNVNPNGESLVGAALVLRDAGPASSAAHDGPITVRGTITNIGSAERPVIALRAAPSGTSREERLLYIVDPDRLLTGIAVDAVVEVSGVYPESPRRPATDATLRVDSVTVIDEPAVPTFPYRG